MPLPLDTTAFIVTAFGVYMYTRYCTNLFENSEIWRSEGCVGD